MNIPAIGPLEQHPAIPEWKSSDPVPVPLLNGEALVFTFTSLTEEDESEIRYAIDAFLDLGLDARTEAGRYIFANYKQMADMVSEDDLGCQISDEGKVWNHVHPTEIYVSRRHRRDQSIYISISAECDWEIEHGLQIVFRRGEKLSRVSDQDGHLTHADAYDTPENEDKIA